MKNLKKADAKSGPDEDSGYKGTVFFYFPGKVHKIHILHTTHYTPKGTVFFYFPGKVRFFAFLRIFEWMNEKAVFFFPVCFFFPPKKSNEWMTFELFRGKEKKQKNAQKFGKKKYKQLLLKNKETSSKSDWMTDELFLGKKKTAVFFFSRFAGKKKKHDFRIWMNEWPTSMSAKKKYGTFGAKPSKSA